MKITTANCLLLTVIMVLGSSLPVFAGVTSSRATFSSDTAIAAPQYIRLQLALDASNTDDTYIGFSPTAKTQYVFNEDAPYFEGYGKVNIASISSDSVLLAINKLPLPGKQSLTINLNVNASADGIYSLNMTAIVNIPQLYEIWLMDAYKNDSVDMRKYKTYAFNLLKSDKNSYGSKRFSLVIRQDPALSVHLLNFTATKAANGAQINWTTENEDNYTNFTVEKSNNGGTTFDVLSGFESSDIGAYSFLDKSPVPLPAANGATAQYRLKIEDINGTISYSDIVTLTFDNLSDNIPKNAVSVYPNPTKSTLNLKIDAGSKSNSLTTESVSNTENTSSTVNDTVYSIKIFNNMGSVIKSETTTDQNWSCDVSNLLPGTYIIQILNNANKSFVGTGKFIKQ